MLQCLAGVALRDLSKRAAGFFPRMFHPDPLQFSDGTGCGISPTLGFWKDHSIACTSLFQPFQQPLFTILDLPSMPGTAKPKVIQSNTKPKSYFFFGGGGQS